MQPKTTQNKWKQKAVERRKQIARLKKRIGEVQQSRDHWKAKYQAQRQGQQLPKAKGHHYPVALVWLCVHLYHCCHCSFRTCSQVVASSALLMQINCRPPQAATVRHWIIKYGYYCYYQEDEYSGEWALIIDESVSIGQEKLLLVLGLPIETWSFDRALRHQDVTVLHLSMATSWKAAGIQEVLGPLAQRVRVAYCVSDQGNNIKKAVATLGWPHIYDCSHQWAQYMKQLYEKEADFLVLMKQVSRLRKAWALSEHCHLIPPSLRSQARFLNIFPLVDWIEKMRHHWGELKEQTRQRLAFIVQHQPLIDELVTLRVVISQMGSVFKVAGINQHTLHAARQALLPCQHGRLLAFKAKVLAAWQDYTPWLSKKSLLCSSDIIESYFGRFKQRIKAKGLQTLTESVLIIGGWSQTPTQSTVEEALTQVSIQHIQQWKQLNTVTSLMQKRKAFFHKKCPKKIPDF